MEPNNLEQMLESIGKELHRIRHEKAEKIEAVAKALGVSHSVIS